MKPVEEVTACVVDYGSFIYLARRLAETMQKVYYYSPFEQEFLGVNRCVIGDGFGDIERLDNPLCPDVLPEIDLFVFPDIGYGSLQHHLKGMGKAVWGSMGADELELIRTKFIATVKKLGMPMVPSVTVKGLGALWEHLQGVDNKWIKVNRFRDDMETWKHFNAQYTARKLEELAKKWGPLKEEITFVVQDEIEDAQEIGFDGWCVDGFYPPESFQGYEKKNELYLGAKLAYDRLPEQVQYVNQKFAAILADYGYRNFWATELRVQGDTPYFIDPTARMPGQTGEQLLRTCKNLPEIIWQGAHGELVAPVWAHTHAAEATMHYTAAAAEDWKTLAVPDEAEPWTMLYHCCKLDGAYHFPPHKSDELGIVMGVGGSTKAAIEDLYSHIELFKDAPVSFHTNEFPDLIVQIDEAEKKGLEFSPTPTPDPEEVLEIKG